ncbi:MAG: TraR/DksA family transcriptional regulator [Syntrophobacteria bacterium]
MVLSEEKRQHFQKMLLHIRQELVNRIRAEYPHNLLEKDYLGDFCDNVITDMGLDSVYTHGERLRKTVQLIDDALDRIAGGDYGICEECGDPINEKRLLLIPFATLCVRCQKKVELKFHTQELGVALVAEGFRSF